MDTFVIFPDQLFNDNSVLDFLKDFPKILIVEEPAYFKNIPLAKIIIYRACMRSYYGFLCEQIPARIKLGNNTAKNPKITTPQISYIDCAKILPRGDTFDYLTGIRSQIHMFRIAACFTWGDKPWENTYYGLPIKFYESPGFLVPYHEIKYGDIFNAKSTQNKDSKLTVENINFSDFLYRFFKIALDNQKAEGSIKYDPSVHTIVAAIPKEYSENNVICRGRSGSSIIGAFTHRPSYELPFGKKSTSEIVSAKKYAKTLEKILTESGEKTKTGYQTADPLPNQVNKLNQDSNKLAPLQSNKSTLNQNTSKTTLTVNQNTNKTTLNLNQPTLINFQPAPRSSSQNTLIPEKIPIKRTKSELFRAKNTIENFDNVKYPSNYLEANKLASAFIKKYVRDYATYPSGAITEILVPLNLGIITPQNLLTTVLSTIGAANKQNVLLFLRDLVYREYVRGVYLTDDRFSSEEHTGKKIGSKKLGVYGLISAKSSIVELSEVSRIKTLHQNMHILNSSLPWYFYWCGDFQCG